MDMRHRLTRRHLAALISAGAVLAGCDDQTNKPSSGATLLNNSEVQDALNALSSAIDDLQSNTGRFDDENWRDVVPEIETAATNVKDAFDSLRTALGANG